jgi:hypothetical protein
MVWGIGIWNALTWHYWPNKGGGLSKIQTLWRQKISKRSIIQIARFLAHHWVRSHLMHGGTYEQMECQATAARRNEMEGR